MRIGTFVGILLVLGAIVFSQSAYTVNEWEQVIITEFGKPIGGPIDEAGLHFKTPFVQEVHRFDKRLLRWDGERHRTITKDRKTILIDVTARWRIADAEQFLMSVQTVERAHRRLDGIMESAVKNEIANFNLYEVVRSSNKIIEEQAKITAAYEEDEHEGRPSVSFTLGKQVPPLKTGPQGELLAGRPVVNQRIIENARRVLNNETTKLGIEIDDVLIKAFNYTGEVERQVYLQMNEELKKIATRFRAQGRRRAEERRGEMVKELETIESGALRDAERIRGEADAEATRIYAEAYGQDPDFYAFLRTLEAQKTAVGKNHLLILSTDAPFFELLSDPKALRR
ncbi:MAG: protease modulator HflC [Deltaproteobacteria bacterium]|nr:MAG: protease modulator HflC [Deltaproteobacteria bacterium]